MLLPPCYVTFSTIPRCCSKHLVCSSGVPKRTPGRLTCCHHQLTGMKSTSQLAPDVEQRIAELVRTLRQAEDELQTLTGGRLDTGRQEAEALRESEERFSGAFEHAPIGVALVSPDGRWLKVNRALCELVGIPRPSCSPAPFRTSPIPTISNIDLENVRRLIAGEIRSYQMEKRYIHARGHLVTVLLSVSLVRDRPGPAALLHRPDSGHHRAQADRRMPCARATRNSTPGGQHHRCLLDPVAGHARGALHQSRPSSGSGAVLRKACTPIRSNGPTSSCRRTVRACWMPSLGSRETHPPSTSSTASCGRTARSAGFVPGDFKSGTPPTT